MDLHLRKLSTGALVPATEEDAAKLARIKSGAVVLCKVTQPRNYEFHKKWFALAKFAYDLWEGGQPKTIIWRGQPVRPNFERFRHDLTILAGHHLPPTFAADGSIKVEAKSLSFGSMSAEEFEQLFSDTIQAVLTKIDAAKHLTEKQLRDYIDQVMAFD